MPFLRVLDIYHLLLQSTVKQNVELRKLPTKSRKTFMIKQEFTAILCQ
jgi:hypothetical protein